MLAAPIKVSSPKLREPSELSPAIMVSDVPFDKSISRLTLLLFDVRFENVVFSILLFDKLSTESVTVVFWLIPPCPKETFEELIFMF